MSGLGEKIIASLMLRTEVDPDESVSQLKSSLYALSTVAAVPVPLPSLTTVMISPGAYVLPVDPATSFQSVSPSETISYVAPICKFVAE